MEPPEKVCCPTRAIPYLASKEKTLTPLRPSLLKQIEVKAVLFDAYGTLASITDPRRPYRQVINEARRRGTELPGDVASHVMASPLTLSELASQLHVPTEALHHAERDLETEVASITLYPETLATLEALQARGLKLGVCSNLAAPYAAPLLKVLPPLDAYLWSFEVGAIKPQPQIFEAACQALECSPVEVLMVGDSLQADVDGARAAGLHAAWLTREGDHGDLQSLDELLQ